MIKRLLIVIAILVSITIALFAIDFLLCYSNPIVSKDYSLRGFGDLIGLLVVILALRGIYKTPKLLYRFFKWVITYIRTGEY